ncbi:hypothetical protein B0T10DRAFT_409859 [Thelonectria olida]|uniref:Pal1 cell morphology n=1 Tax=Thelonectria olida TaxID=1576542 RepID=A0A9P8W138_9HYPO|nr:hypothetical protein B0T10DRAFT_409859 [Thelonectria olida]
MLTPTPLQAKAYILDPLTAPEPSQDTGIGSVAANFKKFSLSESTFPASFKDPRDVRKSSSSHRHRHHHQRSYPTPPTSASPSRSHFHPSNPFATTDGNSSGDFDSPPRTPPRSSHGAHHPRRYPPVSAVIRSSSSRSTQDPPVRPDYQHQRSFSAGNNDLARRRSINQRHPGDMTHRPLEILRKEARAADRAPHLRRKNMPHTDTIDALDTIGGTYHHGGPFDAALVSRNRNKAYSPVAAVHDSNMEAIRATPREYLEDSLRKHMPLQGTALIPNGAEDFHGNVMDYEEGADLMREPDAAGGAYKRWDGIEYHPDDLKGKGPNFEKERDMKEKKRRAKGLPAEYELQSRPPLSTRHRSYEAPGTPSVDAGLGRSHSTSKRFGDGLRRRFGSMRRKKAEAV